MKINNRMHSRDVFGICLLVALVTAYIIGGFTQREPDSFKFLFGTIGILPFAAATGTLIMLVINARHQDRMLAMARKAELAGRFQKGAELMATGEGTAMVSGISIVRGVVLEDHETYYIPALATIGAMLIAPDVEAKTAIRAGKLPPNLVYSNPAASRALTAIADLNPSPASWIEGTPSVDGKFVLREFYLGTVRKTQENLQNINFVSCYINSCTFDRCQFLGSSIMAYFFGKTKFVGCDLTNCDIVDLSVPRDERNSKPGNVTFFDCVVENLKVNGLPYAEWTKLHQAPLHESAPARLELPTK